VATVVRIPSEAEFKTAMVAYRQRENRGPVYFRAVDQINKGWGNAPAMADGIGLLLKSWHNVFYRFGLYDPARLADCIVTHLETLASLRKRTIDSFSLADEPLVRRLFNAFTDALKGGKNGQQESTVATAKALHVLAPGFLPLWDNLIAGAYGQFPMLAPNYIAFCWQMKELASALLVYIPNPDDCSVLKRLDEFSYAVYTQGWVRLHQKDKRQLGE